MGTLTRPGFGTLWHAKQAILENSKEEFRQALLRVKDPQLAVTRGLRSENVCGSSRVTGGHAGSVSDT